MWYLWFMWPSLWHGIIRRTSIDLRPSTLKGSLRIRHCWPIEFAELGSGYARGTRKQHQVTGKGPGWKAPGKGRNLPTKTWVVNFSHFFLDVEKLLELFLWWFSRIITFYFREDKGWSNTVLYSDSPGSQWCIPLPHLLPPSCLFTHCSSLFANWRIHSCDS